MTAQFSAGEPPDLFYLQAEFADAWIEDGLLEPLDPYFAGNPEFDTGPFFDPLIQAFEFEGQTYGLPKDASPLALFYNPDMLEAAGVEPPTTWDELTAAAEALTTDDVYGLCLGAELPRVGAFIYQNGGGIYNEDGSELTIAAPESVEAIDFVLGMHEAGTLMVPADTGAGWCGEAFGLGQAAMTMEGNWLYPAMENDFPDTPFEVAELPQGTQQGNLAFTVAYSIGADSVEQGGRVGAAPVPDRPRGNGRVDRTGPGPAVSRRRRAGTGARGALGRPRVRHGVRLRAGLPGHPGGVQRRADEGPCRGRHGPGRG